MGLKVAEDSWFHDELGRIFLLRGINLSGNIKLPFTPYQPSHKESKPHEKQSISFVGRPFPVDEADEHLSRLRRWGFTFLRYNITWEAIEHQGPGIYDDEYVDYVIQILKKAQKLGFYAFIDPHQDVWSRFCGGSGAPAWTLELAGFQVENLHDAYAAVLHYRAPAETEALPMLWQTNCFKLACATMFTLFFGGNAFAPKLTVPCSLEGHQTKDMPIQDFLQLHYASAVCYLARRIADAGLSEMVVGYDSMNEPSGGYLGMADLNGPTMPCQELKLGLTPTAFQGMVLGEGQVAHNVEVWGKALGMIPRCQRRQPEVCPSRRAWKDGLGCVWARHGVWDVESGTLLKPNYFAFHPTTGQPVDWLKDFWYPFALRFRRSLKEAHPGAFFFVEPPVGLPPPPWDSEDKEGLVFAPHWYDGLTLMSRKWNGQFNVNYLAVQRKTKNVLRTIGRPKTVFSEMLAMIKEDGAKSLGPTPCVIGEVGIPYDLGGRRAYRTGNYASQLAAYHANLTALEQNLLSYTLWTYVADNTHEHGDQWNGEDLSIFSRDTGNNATDGVGPASWWGRIWRNCKYQIGSSTEPEYNLDAGGRALEALLRPVPEKTALGGVPKRIEFDYRAPWFCYSFETDGTQCAQGRSATTEIWLPDLHFPFEHRRRWESTIRVSSGEWTIERISVELDSSALSRFTSKTLLIWTCLYQDYIKQTHRVTIGKKHKYML